MSVYTKPWEYEGTSYSALHMWVKTHKTKPDLCEHCKQSKKLQWANKSQKYKKDLDDWLALCARCHAAYDSDRRILTPEWKDNISKAMIKLYCGKGHKLSGDNLIIEKRKKSGRDKRDCRICKKARWDSWYARNKHSYYGVKM